MNDARKASTDNTERLVVASQAGDRGAFDQLVQLNQRRAMQLAVRILGSVNDAAEAVQTAFVRAYLNIGKLKQPKRFEIWLLRIVANAAISQRRIAKRRRERVKIANSCCEDNKVVSAMDKQIAVELKDAIQQAMLKLSKKEAKAISLFGLKGLSHKEVAEIMDCSVEAARWYVFRARQKLKLLLKDCL